MPDPYEILDTFKFKFKKYRRHGCNIVVRDYPGILVTIKPYIHPDSIGELVVEISNSERIIDKQTFEFNEYLTSDPQNPHPNTTGRLKWWHHYSEWKWYIDYPISTDPISKAIKQYCDDVVAALEV